MEARWWCSLWCVSSTLKMEGAYSCKIPVNFCQTIHRHRNPRGLCSWSIFLILYGACLLKVLGKVGYSWVWRLSGSHYALEPILVFRFYLFVSFVIITLPFRTNNISARMDSVLLRGWNNSNSLLNFFHLSSVLKLLGTWRTLDHACYDVTV